MPTTAIAAKKSWKPCARKQKKKARRRTIAVGVRKKAKLCPEIPADVQPVVRFKTPLDGVTKWTDLVKGEISIPNEALDDLIIARADGTPTYNFCVVVDDYDMGITPRYPW